MRVIAIIFLVVWSGVNYAQIDIEFEKKIDQAYTFCEENKLNTNFCVLVNMKEHSGKKRLHIIDFNSKSILKSGLCSHGCGTAPWGEDTTKLSPVFSNVPESHCSSLGKYRIGKRGWSNWGIHVNYKLHGLSGSNNNAFKRVIVLHSWEMVSEEEVYPNGTPEGWGCPAVSANLMRYLDQKLKVMSTPVLLWIYND